MKIYNCILHIQTSSVKFAINRWGRKIGKNRNGNQNSIEKEYQNRNKILRMYQSTRNANIFKKIIYFLHIREVFGAECIWDVSTFYGTCRLCKNNFNKRKIVFFPSAIIKAMVAKIVLEIFEQQLS